MRRFVAYPVALFIAVLALYGQFLWNPIVFDDLPFFTLDRSGVQPVSNFHFSPIKLRSLPYATLAWGKDAFGLDMLHFRIENLLLHAAVAVALFSFLARLFDTLYGARANSLFGSRALAFCAALLFALHPVAVYAAGYLVQRSLVMATLFSLLAMLAYLHGSVRQKPLWLWACVPLYYLAVFAKEHVIMLPAVLLALTILLHQDWRAKLRERWRVFAALAAIALFVVAIRKGVIGSAYEIYAMEMLEVDNELNYPMSVLTQSWLFFKYAGLWLFPNPDWMSADMREPFATSFASPYLAAFAAFLMWGAGAFWLLLRRGRTGLLGFALLFPWLMFMTEFSTIRVQESFVLYRSYLWAVGACAVIPLLLDALDKQMGRVVVAAVCLALFPISMDRLATFSHPLMLWDDAEKLVHGRDDLHGAYRIYYNRGTELVKADEYDYAIRDLKRAVFLKPDWPYPYNNLGAAYMKKEQWREAADAFTMAIETASAKGMGTNAKTHYGRAMAYGFMGETEKAKQDYQISCRRLGKGCEKL